jgi:hypothetical protein
MMPAERGRIPQCKRHRRNRAGFLERCIRRPQHTGFCLAAYSRKPFGGEEVAVETEQLPYEENKEETNPYEGPASCRVIAGVGELNVSTNP